MRTKRWYAPAALVAAVLTLAACSVQQQVSLQRDGSGTTTMEIALDPILSTYFRDLSESVGASADGPIFDTEAIREAFEERPGVTARSVELNDEGELSLELAFDDIGEVVASQERAVRRLVSVREEGNATTVSFRATPQTVRDAMAMSPMYGSQAASFILPGEGASLSAAEYTEQLAWALEEYADERPVRRVVAQSAIQLTVAVEGEVVSQRGGRRLDASRVRFEIPVVELLTLDGERLFEVTFR